MRPYIYNFNQMQVFIFMTDICYKKVFISGGAGFIGQCLAKHFRENGSEICGIDRYALPEFNIEQAELSHPSSWKTLLKGCDLVIHTAAVVSNALTYDETWQVNVAGTKTLLDAAVELGDTKRFVHLSSVAAMGFEHTGPIHEGLPLKTINHPYCDTKITSEHLVLSYHASGKIPCTIIRPADVYGPGSKPWILTPIKELKRKTFMVPKGMFGPVYIDDLINGIYLAANQKTGEGETFIISGFGEVSNQEYFSYLGDMLNIKKIRSMNKPLGMVLTSILERLINLLGKTTEINPNSIKMLSRPSADYSHAKASKLLNYQPHVSLKEGMKNCEQWLKSEGIV